MHRWLTIFTFLLLIVRFGYSQQVELKNNFFYLDGQKFFIKGIGYEVNALPGQLPWNRTFNPDQLKFDMQRIISGGFNTIRTWSAFTAEELNYLDQFNIKIIMGIWIDPGGDFSDSQFILNAENTVRNVLSYSKYHNNIIGYLIMNEPLAETVFNAGYDNTIQLYTDLINIIHTEHPGRPVSISNSSNGTYINADVFDFTAYNVYIYNPVTVNYLYGYRDYTRFLKELSSENHPLVITEYGLSVSPSGPGNMGYGGNSLAQQQEGDLSMYKSLVDGGASGSCVFNYSDGWWKAGNEFVHDDNPEEWFGLVGYSSLTDHQGQTRPAWDAIKTYQSAIITQPAGSEIYVNKVPVEIFLNDTIRRVDVLLDNVLVDTKSTTSGLLTDTIVFNHLHMKDATLVFNCYDGADRLVKTEEKNILITDSAVTLPTIQISTNNDFRQTGTLNVAYQIHKSPDFTAYSAVDYIYYSHSGWDYGQKFETALPADVQQYTINAQHAIDNSVQVITVGAAFTISYQHFSKRIVQQATFIRNAGYNDVRQYSSGNGVQLYPNPATDDVNVGNCPSNTVYRIFNQAGITLQQGFISGSLQKIDIRNLSAGVYFLQLAPAGKAVITKKLLVR